MPGTDQLTEEQKKVQEEAEAAKAAEEAAAKAAEDARAAQSSNASQDDLKNLYQKIDDIKKFVASGVAKPEDIEEKYKKLEEETGFTKQNLEYLGQAIPNMVAQYMAPLVEDSGKESAKSILGKEGEGLIADVERLMAAQPAHVRANKEAWANTAYMVKGKNSDRFTKAPSSNGNRTTIVGGNVQGLQRPSGGTPPPSDKKYDADETSIIARYFAGDAKEYEKYTNSKRVEDLKPTPKYKDPFRRSE